MELSNSIYLKQFGSICEASKYCEVQLPICIRFPLIGGNLEEIVMLVNTIFVETRYKVD